MTYCLRAAEELRRHRVSLPLVCVHAHQRAQQRPVVLKQSLGQPNRSTNDTAELVRLSVSLARSVWRSGFRYAKAGVIMTELVPEVSLQPSVWSDVDRERRAEQWKVVDGLNLELGGGTISTLGMGGTDSSWNSELRFAPLDGQHSGRNCLGLKRVRERIWKAAYVLRREPFGTSNDSHVIRFFWTPASPLYARSSTTVRGKPTHSNNLHPH